MKKISRLFVAAVLVGALAVVATGVWASPKFESTTPPASECNSSNNEVTNGIVKVKTNDCSATAEQLKDIDGFLAAARVGSTNPDSLIKVCIKVDDANKDAKMYTLIKDVWTEVTPAATYADGYLCAVDQTPGDFAVK